MKKHFILARYFVFTLAATLCMPVHAMWRQAGQKMSTAVTQAVTAAARQVRFCGATLGKASKNLQSIVASRGLQTATRVQASLPEMRPFMTRTYNTAAQTATNSLRYVRNSAPQVLLIAKQVATGTTVIGTGVYGMKFAETCELNKFDINRLEDYSVEFINKHYSVIIERYKDDEKAHKALIKFVVKNITHLAPSVISSIVGLAGYDGLKLLFYPIRLHFASLADETIQYFCTNFEWQYATNSWFQWRSTLDWDKLEEEAHKELLDKIVPTTLTNREVKLLVEHQASLVKLGIVLEKKPENLAALSCGALDNLKHIPTHNLAVLVAAHKNENPLQKDLKAELILRLANLQKEDRLEFLRVMALVKNSLAQDFYDNVIDTAALTISEQHILSTPNIFKKNDSEYQSDERMKRMVASIIQAERDHQKDYYTFVHGQRWDYFFAEKMFTDLWSVHHGKEVKDYLFAHVRNRDDASTEKKIYKEVMANGRGENRQHLLFLNAPFFGNTTNVGSSTARYFAWNGNVGNVELPLKKVFELHGDTDVYEHHKQKIDALQQEYATLGNGHGNVLFFAIPKKLAKDYVYLAKPGGYKKQLRVEVVSPSMSSFKKFFFGEGYIKTTDDLHEVVDTLTHHPEKIKESSGRLGKNPVDENEFCLIMVKDAMNPESGIKVKAFNVADPKKMQKFWKKYDTLMAGIKADIEAKKAGKPLSSQQRADRIFERYQELFA